MLDVKPLSETFWLQIDDDTKLTQVSKDVFVQAERLAGFNNIYGPDSEPATGGFFYTGPLGKIIGEVRTSDAFTTAVVEQLADQSPEEVLNALYVVRWMSREFEPGWGVDNTEEFCTLHKTMESAERQVEERFKDRRSLIGAGDYFLYPTGPDHTYHVYEIPVVAGHKIFDLIDSDGLNISRMPKDENVAEFRKQLIIRMQDEQAIIHTVSFQGLAPKPMHSAPIYMFPSLQDPDWPNKLLE